VYTLYQPIIDVKAMSDYTLLVTFKNNEVKLLDMKPYLNKGIYAELKDTNLFNTVHVSYDSIEWANQADLDPEFIYIESKPYQIKNAM
jgi:hypothetical protein